MTIASASATAPASTDPAAPARLRRRPTITAALAGAAVLAAAALAAGCSSSGSGSGGNGIVPKGAAVVATVDLHRGANAPLPQMHALAKRIPAEALVDSRVSPESIAKMVTQNARHQLSWSTDIEPWLGNEGGIAAWLKPGAASKDGDTGKKGHDDRTQGIAWLDSKDDDKATAAMTKALGKGDVSSISGTDVHLASHVWWAVFDDHAVVASSKDAMKRSIDAADGDALESTTEWKRLDDFHAKGDPAVAVIVTDAFAEQARQAAKDHEAEATTDQERAKANQLVKFTDRLDALHDFGAALGANKDAYWLDVHMSTAHGDSAKAADGNALKRLGNMPASSLAAAAGAVDLDAMARRAKDTDTQHQLDSAFSMLDDSSKGNAAIHSMVGDLQKLASNLLSAEHVQRVADAYGDGVTAAVVHQGTTFAVVGTVDVDDPKAARDLAAEDASAMSTFLGKYVPGAKVAPEPGAGQNDSVNYVISGLPVQMLLKDVPPAKLAQAGKVLGPAAIAELQKGRVTIATEIVDGQMRVAFPAAGLAALDSDQHLDGNSDRFARDMKTADVPRDAGYASWIDTQGLVQVGLGFLPASQASAKGVVTAQASSVGGIVAYSVSKQDGDRTSRDDLVYLPIYES
jgi:hypothetical protein